MNLTSLKSKVYRFKRLYPSSLLEVSKTEKMLGLKFFLGQQKKAWGKKLGPKKILGQQNFGSKKKLCLKKFLEKKILSQKKFWVQNNFWI